jgi:glycine betaine/proline transport system substrate-binding protein
MKKTWKLAGVFVLALSLILTGCGQSVSNDGGEDKGTIVFGVTPWTSTTPPTHIAKQLLEQAGYKVELKNADVGVVYAGLKKGDIDIFMDAWLPDMHANYMAEYGDGIEDIAVSYPNGELGWVIPKSVEGIDSVADLKGKEDLFEGKIYGIDPGAGMTITSKEMIEAYGLDLEYMAGSEATMMSQVKRLSAKDKPVLFLGWRPHSMFATYDLKVLKDEKEFFKTSEVHVLVNKDFKNKYKEAYEIMSKWSINVGDIEQQILAQEQGKQWEELAAAWIKEHPEEVKAITGK